MNKLKDKKVIALAALAVVIVGVGAFQVVGSGGDAKPAKKSASKPASSAKKNAPSDDWKPASLKKAEEVSGSATAYSAETDRVSVSATTTTSVTHEEGGGEDVKTHRAYQYESGLAANDSLNRNGASDGEIASSVTQMNNLAPSPLSERDPFWVPPAGRDKPRKPNAKPLSEVGVPSAQTVAGGSKPNARPIQRAGDTVAPLQPGGLGGTLPPVNPGANPAGQGGQSPAMAGAPPKPNNGMKINPSAPARLPDEFAYTLSGTVDGANPVAVLSDDSGKQRMVQAGDRIGNGRVVKVSNGVVVVRHNGKLITLRPGGSSGKS